MTAAQLRPGAARPTIRRGRPGDADDIAALIERDNRRPADRGEIRRSLAASPSAVALEGGELVGFAYSRPFSPDILDLRNVLVAESRHGRGIGRALFEEVQEQARAAGYRALIGVNCWLRPGATRERAAAARAFWRRMGWTIVFATPGSVVLAKWLGRPPDG